MRLIFLVTLFFISCKPNPEISFIATKNNDVFEIENSLSIKQFLEIADSLACDGYKITGNTLDSKEEYVQYWKPDCDKSKISHYRQNELPVYACNGYREYGINLCENQKSNFNKMREFYLNPQKRFDFPLNPQTIRVKIVAEETETINSIIPSLIEIKSMRDKIDNGNLAYLPLLFRFENAWRDSLVYGAPEQLKNNRERNQ